MAFEVVVEHLNHLGIVAEVCREIRVAEWLNAQDPTSRQQVSVGTATVAIVLNGLGFSNRQLYLVPQFFADKPVEHLLGAGITAATPHRPSVPAANKARRPTFGVAPVGFPRPVSIWSLLSLSPCLCLLVFDALVRQAVCRRHRATCSAAGFS